MAAPPSRQAVERRFALAAVTRTGAPDRWAAADSEAAPVEGRVTHKSKPRSLTLPSAVKSTLCGLMSLSVKAGECRSAAWEVRQQEMRAGGKPGADSDTDDRTNSVF
jgi:hypothetical protein